MIRPIWTAPASVEPIPPRGGTEGAAKPSGAKGVGNEREKAAALPDTAQPRLRAGAAPHAVAPASRLAPRRRALSTRVVDSPFRYFLMCSFP